MPTPCAICAVPFVPDIHHPRAQTCSRPCNRKLEYRNHKKSYFERAISFRRANPERFRQYVKRTHARNPELYRTLWKNRQHVRKARIRANQHEKIPHYWWLERIAFQEGRCWWCGVPSKLEMDHVIPVKLGGCHMRENIVGACGTCNKKKRAHYWPISQGGKWMQTPKAA